MSDDTKPEGSAPAPAAKPVAAPRPPAAPIPDLAGKTTSIASAGGAAAAKPAVKAATRDADDTSPLLNRRAWMALAWGTSQGAALAWADKAFLQIMRQDKCPVAGLYYAGVRVFGRPFRFFSSLFSG